MSYIWDDILFLVTHLLMIDFTWIHPQIQVSRAVCLALISYQMKLPQFLAPVILADAPTWSRKTFATSSHYSIFITSLCRHQLFRRPCATIHGSLNIEKIFSFIRLSTSPSNSLVAFHFNVCRWNDNSLTWSSASVVPLSSTIQPFVPDCRITPEKSSNSMELAIKSPGANSQHMMFQ